jgi:hypothetical protein
MTSDQPLNKDQPQNGRRAKALDYAQDSIKQILALSTGVVALTLTFFKDFGATSGVARDWMIGSWVLFFVSIIAGLIALLSMTSLMWPHEEADRAKVLDTWTLGVRVPAFIQVIAFGLGFTAMLIAGWLALSRLA